MEHGKKVGSPKKVPRSQSESTRYRHNLSKQQSCDDASNLLDMLDHPQRTRLPKVRSEQNISTKEGKMSTSPRKKKRTFPQSPTKRSTATRNGQVDDLLLPELVESKGRTKSDSDLGTGERNAKVDPKEAIPRLEAIISQIREKIESKQILVSNLVKEVERMSHIFEKAAKLDADKRKESEDKQEEDTRLSYQERVSLLEKGPFNLVFHGIESDWMEEEMADDPDFKRDVLEQRVKRIIKEEAGMVREIPLLDVYRYNEGPRVKDAPPVVVSFKNRKDKEHVMWRARDKLRKIGIMVTEDSTARLTKLREEMEERKREEEKRKKILADVGRRTRRKHL